MMIRRWHEARGRSPGTVIVPDTSHGTNPASAALCGFRIVTVKSDADGCTDLAALKAALSDDTAAFMVTNPNTLGIFEPHLVREGGSRAGRVRRDLLGQEVATGLPDLLDGELRWIRVEDPRVTLQDLGERPVRDAVAVGEAPAA